MPEPKKARLLGDDKKGVFCFKPLTTRNQVPKDVMVAVIFDRGTLSDNSFIHCQSLVEVIFQEGLHTIGKGAFFGCESLAEVKLPSTLRVISTSAFCYCKALRSFPDSLPTGLTYIGANAFESSGLHHLNVPPTVETIGKYAFSNCRQLKSVVLPPSLPAIDTAMFYACQQLRGVEIPETVTEIGGIAFDGCSSLLRLDLSHCTECVKIGFQAFARCSNLLTLYLPPNLEGAMPAQTFVNCSSLTHLRIPQNVVSIGCGSTFEQCTSLVSLELPEGLEKIQIFQPWFFGFPDDMTTCSSLVNLYMPPSQTVQKRDMRNDSLPAVFRLGRVASGKEDCIQKLQLRFGGLPLHKVCYFHSYHTVKDTKQEIKAILMANPAAAHKQDIFGMTPLHILALAQTPVAELLQELFTSTEMLQSEDLFGSTPLDYLCKIPSIEEKDTISLLVREFLQQKLPFIGLGRWKQEVLELEKRARLTTNVDTLKEGVKAMLKKLAQVESLEVLSLLEMVLWKIKMNESRDEVASTDAKLQQNDDRHACRVHCGISVVLSNVLPFLDKLPVGRSV